MSKRTFYIYIICNGVVNAMYEKIGLKKYTLHHDVFLLKKDDGQKMWYVCV